MNNHTSCLYVIFISMSNNMFQWTIDSAINSTDWGSSSGSHFNENDMSEDDLFGDEQGNDDEIPKQNGLDRAMPYYVVEANPIIPVVENEAADEYPPAEEGEEERTFQELLQEEDTVGSQQEYDVNAESMNTSIKESENADSSAITGSAEVTQDEKELQLQEQEYTEAEGVMGQNEEDKRDMESGVYALKKVMKESKKLLENPDYLFQQQPSQMMSSMEGTDVSDVKMGVEESQSSSIREAESVHVEQENSASSTELEVKELKAKLEACLKDAQRWEREWSEATAICQKVEKEKEAMEKELLKKQSDAENLEKRENDIQMLSEDLKSMEKENGEMKREKEEMEKELEEMKKELEAVKREKEEMEAFMSEQPPEQQPPEQQPPEQQEPEQQQPEQQEDNDVPATEKENTSGLQAERDALLHQIDDLKMQTAQLSQQLKSILAEESVDDSSLSATPSAVTMDDDYSSVFTFTTMSSNPYAQKAIQRQNEVLTIRVDQLKAQNLSNQTTIINLKQSVEKLKLEVHNKDTRINELQTLADEQNRTMESFQKDINDNKEFMEQQIRLNKESNARMNEMKEKMKEKEEKAATEKAEREKAEKVAKEAKEALALLEKEKGALEKEMNSLKAELDQKQATIEALEAQEAQRREMEQEEALSVQSHQSVEEKESTVVLSDVTLEVMNGRDPIRLHLPLEENEVEITALRDLISECQTSTTTYRNNILEERRRNAQLQASLDQKTAEVQELDSKLTLQKVQLDTETRKNDGCEKARAVAVAEMEEKTKALEKVTAEKASLEEEAEVLRQKVATLESSLKVNESSIDQSKAELSASQDLLSSKTKELDETLTELTEKQRACETAEKKYVELQQQEKARKESYDALAESYKTLKARVKTIVQETKEKLTEAYQKQVNQISTQLSQKEAELETLRKQYSDAMVIVKSMNHQHPEGYGNELEEMRAEVEGYKTMLERMKKELSHANKRLAKQRGLNEQMNVCLNEKEAQLKKLYDMVKQ